MTRAASRPDAQGGSPWRTTAHGVVMRVRLTPKSSRSAIDGIGPTAEGPALLARVNAVPEGGEANRALLTLVAEWLGYPKSAVALVTGEKSRVKSVAIAGDAAEIGARLDQRTAAKRDG